MNKKAVRIISVILTVAFALIFSAGAVDMQPFSNKYFMKAEANLFVSFGLNLDFNVRTNLDNNQIGVGKVVLHDMTTDSTTNYPGTSGSGKKFSDAIKLSGAIKGHRYYAEVTFYADDLTTTCQTDPLTY